MRVLAPAVHAIATALARGPEEATSAGAVRRQGQVVVSVQDDPEQWRRRAPLLAKVLVAATWDAVDYEGPLDKAAVGRVGGRIFAGHVGARHRQRVREALALLRRASVSGAVPTVDSDGKARKEQLRGLAPLEYWPADARLLAVSPALLRLAAAGWGRGFGTPLDERFLRLDGRHWPWTVALYLEVARRWALDWTGYRRLCLGGGVLVREERLAEAVSADFGRHRWRSRIEAGMGDGVRLGLWAWRWAGEGLLVEPALQLERTLTEVHKAAVARVRARKDAERTSPGGRRCRWVDDRTGAVCGRPVVRGDFCGAHAGRRRSSGSEKRSSGSGRSRKAP